MSTLHLLPRRLYYYFFKQETLRTEKLKNRTEQHTHRNVCNSNSSRLQLRSHSSTAPNFPGQPPLTATRNKGDPRRRLLTCTRSPCDCRHFLLNCRNKIQGYRGSRRRRRKGRRRGPGMGDLYTWLISFFILIALLLIVVFQVNFPQKP